MFAPSFAQLSVVSQPCLIKAVDCPAFAGRSVGIRCCSPVQIRKAVDRMRRMAGLVSGAGWPRRRPSPMARNALSSRWCSGTSATDGARGHDGTI